MDDADLDLLLIQARPQVGPAAEGEARRVAHSITNSPSLGIQGSRRRRGWVLPLAVGTVLLTGAGTLVAQQLSLPPFQTLDSGLSRSIDGVPVDYRTDAGTVVSCLAFVEFRDLTPTQEDQVNGFITDSNWEGYGQQMYDELPAADREVEMFSDAMGSVVVDDLQHRALEAAPGTKPPVADGPTITGGAMSCEYPEGLPSDEG